MPFLTIGDQTLHYAVDGAASAPALILSNSLGANLTMWDRQAAQWAKRFRVVRYDQRGQAILKLERETHVAGLTDMEELIASVNDKDVANYLREALACYGAGAHRACVVLSHAPRAVSCRWIFCRVRAVLGLPPIR
jgi:pimeloyl-ACP methyl ester carboxylesterase